MPITVELQSEQHRVSVVASGALTQPERLAALARCVELLRANVGLGVLFDARAATTAPTSLQTREIMESSSLVAPVFVAGVAFVITQPVQYGMARMLQSLLEPSGISMAVFTEVAPASVWLGARWRNS